MRTEGDFEGGEDPSGFYLSFAKKHMKVNRNPSPNPNSQVSCEGNDVTWLSATHCREQKETQCFIFIFEVEVVHKVHQGDDSVLTIATCHSLVSSKTTVFIVFAFSSSKL